MHLLSISSIIIMRSSWCAISIVLQHLLGVHKLSVRGVCKTSLTERPRHRDDSGNTDIKVMTLSPGNPTPCCLLVHFLKLRNVGKGRLCECPVTKYLPMFLLVSPLSSAVSERACSLQGTGASDAGDAFLHFRGSTHQSQHWRPQSLGLFGCTPLQETSSLPFFPSRLDTSSINCQRGCHRGKCYCLS